MYVIVNWQVTFYTRQRVLNCYKMLQTKFLLIYLLPCSCSKITCGVNPLPPGAESRSWIWQNFTFFRQFWYLVFGGLFACKFDTVFPHLLNNRRIIELYDKEGLGVKTVTFVDNQDCIGKYSTQTNTTFSSKNPMSQRTCAYM